MQNAWAKKRDVGIVVSTWPSSASSNPYIQLYEASLEKSGIQRGPGCIINDTFLAEHKRDVDALHFQWAPEELWRAHGKSLIAQARAIVGLWRYLRLAKSLGYRVIWTIHDLEHHEGSTAIDRLGISVLVKFCDLGIVHDEHTHQAFRSRYPSASCDLIVMEHGNYSEVFPSPVHRETTRSVLGLSAESRLLVCQGKLLPYKGYEDAISAVKCLGPQYHLVIAGEASSQQYLEELRSRADGLPRVHILPTYQTDRQISDLFAAADCILLPYRKITGSGAIITALTLGRGFVASRLPFFERYVVRDPLAGELFSPSNASALCDAIERFFADAPVDARHAAARSLGLDISWDRATIPVVQWYRSQTWDHQD